MGPSLSFRESGQLCSGVPGESRCFYHLDWSDSLQGMMGHGHPAATIMAAEVGDPAEQMVISHAAFFKTLRQFLVTFQQTLSQSWYLA